MATAYKKNGATIQLINASDIINDNVITKVGSNVGFNATAGTKDILINTDSAVGWRNMRTNVYTESEFDNLAYNTTIGITGLNNCTVTKLTAPSGILNMSKCTPNTANSLMMVTGRLQAALTTGYYYFRCKKKWTTVGDSRFQVYGSTSDGTATQTATLNLASTGEGIRSGIIQIPASPESNFYNFRCFNSNPSAGDYMGDFMIVRLGTTIPNYMDARWCEKHIPDKLNADDLPQWRTVWTGNQSGSREVGGQEIIKLQTPGVVLGRSTRVTGEAYTDPNEPFTALVLPANGSWIQAATDSSANLAQNIRMGTTAGTIDIQVQGSDPMYSPRFRGGIKLYKVEQYY